MTVCLQTQVEVATFITSRTLVKFLSFFTSNHSGIVLINILSIPLAGSDSTSSFTGKGKMKCIKIVCSNVEYVHAFHDLGKQTTVNQSTMSHLRKFVFHLYGQENEIDLDNHRADLIVH